MQVVYFGAVNQHDGYMQLLALSDCLENVIELIAESAATLLQLMNQNMKMN